jgi:hypothetical protein
MRDVRVFPGERVTAGEQIGEVGDLGNATGCHLHFEVHPHGGSIYEDGVDPSQWLRDNVGRSSSPPSSGGGGFVVATFNTLGSSHTATGGKRAELASGPERTIGLVALLDEHRVNVAGLQEFQAPQARAFQRLAGNRYARFSPSESTENSIVWRRDRWSMVRSATFTIPYFDGHPRQMPIVQLRALATGALTTFVNVHNPADTRRYPRQGRWRAEAVTREITLVSRLSADGRHVVLTGDMNDRHDVFCRIGAATTLRTSLPASAGPCRPPAAAGIDWIFSNDESTGEVLVDRKPKVTGLSDHPLLVWAQ